MIGDPEGGRWRGPQSFVDSAEIVVTDVKGNGRNVVVELLGKAVR